MVLSRKQEFGRLIKKMVCANVRIGSEENTERGHVDVNHVDVKFVIIWMKGTTF